MSLDSNAIIDAVASHAAASGWFERVNRHEPKNAPGHGLTAAVWVDQLGPVPAGSGLRKTSARVVLNVRVFQNMLAEPQDEIDPNMMSAVDALMTAYSGDFELGGNVRNVDLLAQAGTPLAARSGYLHQDNRMFRIYDITLPLIVSDVWEQTP